MTRLIVILGFATAFAAGLVVGRSGRCGAASPTTRPSSHAGRLTAELNLTPQQQEQLKAIWSATASGGGRQRDEHRAQLAKERDEAIGRLVRPEDKAQYEQILKQYADKSSAMEREGRAAFDAAVEQTRQILTPEQRQRYDEILQRHKAEKDGRDHDRHWGDRRGPGSRNGEHSGSRPTR